MKRTFILVLLFLCSLLSYGQQKGEMYIAGSLHVSAGMQSVTSVSGGYSKEVSNQPLSTSFSLGAEYAYFPINNLRLALAVSYSLTVEPYNQVGGKWYNTVVNEGAINPNIAYYVKIVDKFFYTPEIGVSIPFGSYKTPLSEYESYTSPCVGWNIYANLVAFEFRATQHFALGISYGAIQYVSLNIMDKTDKNSSVRSNYFRFNLGTAGVSARYYF